MEQLQCTAKVITCYIHVYSTQKFTLFSDDNLRFVHISYCTGLAGTLLRVDQAVWDSLTLVQPRITHTLLAVGTCCTGLKKNCSQFAKHGRNMQHCKHYTVSEVNIGLSSMPDQRQA